MSIPVDNPWTEDEKVVLLNEIIRADRNARINSTVLADLIRQHQIEPNWANMPLPHGRSLNSCTVAFNELLSLRPPPQVPRNTNYAPILSRSSLPTPSQKRPLPPERSNTIDRAILPRPPVLEQPNGDKLRINQLSKSEILEPQRKKRGRPSNKALEERRAAAIARGDHPDPPKLSASRKPKNTSMPHTSSVTLGVPEPGRVPVASPDPLQTPQTLATAKSADSSSGKKRKRAMNSETPSSPVSATKKRNSPRETKHRSLDQSPTTSSGRGVPATQQPIPGAHPRGSISELLSMPEEHDSLQRPDVQMAGTESVETVPTTRSSPRRSYEPSRTE